MNQPIFAGIDVGGTNIKIGLVDNEGNVLGKSLFPTKPQAHSQDALQEAGQQIMQLVTSCDRHTEELVAIGLATPGPLDLDTGCVLTPFNLPGWHHRNVRDALKEISGLPVVFSNDAGAAAFGEYWIGSGKQYSSLVLLTLGTGIGGGIIIDDRMVDGAHSHGAEIGHMIVDPSDDARICSCGKKGHLEAYTSASALVKRLRGYLKSGSDSVLQDLFANDPRVSTLDIFNAAEQGDSLANELIHEVAFYLGNAVVSLAHIIDPQAVFLGGAMTFGGNTSGVGMRFIEQIRTFVKNCSLPRIASQLTIEYASLGSDAGFVGAAGLAKRYHKTALQT